MVINVLFYIENILPVWHVTLTKGVMTPPNDTNTGVKHSLYAALFKYSQYRDILDLKQSFPKHCATKDFHSLRRRRDLSHIPYIYEYFKTLKDKIILP